MENYFIKLLGWRMKMIKSSRKCVFIVWPKCFVVWLIWKNGTEVDLIWKLSSLEARMTVNYQGIICVCGSPFGYTLIHFNKVLQLWCTSLKLTALVSSLLRPICMTANTHQYLIELLSGLSVFFLSFYFISCF